MVTLFISLFGELVVNDQALVVRYKGNWYFPALADTYPIRWVYTPKVPRTGKFFGMEKDAEGQPYSYPVNYRGLQDKWNDGNGEGWLIMPVIPHDPYKPNFLFSCSKFTDRSIIETSSISKSIIVFVKSE